MEQKIKKVHFAFAGGAAVGAVAALASKNGFEVSACEKLDPNSPYFSQLKTLGIRTFDSEDSSHIDGVDALVVSNATAKIDPENPELLKSKKEGIPTLLAEEFLANYLLVGKRVIAVSGTNGKSTTTAMLGIILEKAGFDPSVMVGAIVPSWKTNFRTGTGKYFVLEADEYSDKFLLYRPEIEIITNIELDHPDFFKDLFHVQESFEKFAGNLAENGKIFLGPDIDLESNKEKQISFQEKDFDLKIPGKHNQCNAAMAFSVASYLGIDEQMATRSLESFSGIGRRFEFVGEEKGVKVFDDYAHHPSGIEVTLEAASERFPGNRIWCVLQPHTYSRLERLFAEFVSSLENSTVSEIVILPVFGSREQLGNIGSLDLVKAIKKKPVHYMENFDLAATFIAKNASHGDVVMVLGAGDIYKLSPLILKKLENKV